MRRSVAFIATRVAPRGAQCARVSDRVGPHAEWYQDEEDEAGRPLSCPAGLGAEDLLPLEKEYWKTRFEESHSNQNIDRPGKQTIPTDRAANEPYFNTNPAVPDSNPLHLDSTLASRVPMVGCCPDEIVVPVFNLDKEQVGVRKLDPYIFGCAPEADILFQMWRYELRRATGFGGWEKLNPRAAPGPTRRLLPWYMAPHTVGKVQRNGSWRSITNISGATERGSRRLTDNRTDVSPMHQSLFLRQALTLKLMKERLIIVEDFNFPVASVDVMRDWVNSWGFDRERHMAYVIDGGSASAPSQEMHENNYWTNIFCYGLQVQEMRSMNGLDILRHHYCVMTEGALVQHEKFFQNEKAGYMPPHLRKKTSVPLADLGETDYDWATIEEEAAFEVANMEDANFTDSRTLHDPWLNGKRWDANEARIKDHRRFISEHLPRVGSPINTDIRKYWEGKGVRLPDRNSPRNPAHILPEAKLAW
eukprot:TRINITY_DN27480_c0_g2_i1.p1 TRINITY_DN27480_c0_g2~~TRINITY_DN27480_c0_g2_i1.p1  ORF type:complete len:489 (+),score=129.73 TRINITY_DN27480_c0_g2_i1:43-1467(+)